MLIKIPSFIFKFYIMTISAYAMVLAIHYIFQCSDKDWKGIIVFFYIKEITEYVVDFKLPSEFLLHGFQLARTQFQHNF